MPTLKDVSKASGYSIATVSRVLRNDSTLNVPSSTKKIIFEAAKRLGYGHKTLEKSLKNKRHIGIVLWYDRNEELSDPYFLEIRRGIEAIASQQSVTLKTIHKGSTGGFDLSPMDGIDGLIALGKFTKKEINQFLNETSHIVFVDASPDEVRFSSVVIDFRRSVKQVLNFILNTQYRPIGYIGGYEKVNSQILYGERRKKFFLDALKRNGLYDESLIRVGFFKKESGYELMHDLLKTRRPRIVFCANDSIALGALRAIHEQGLKVPDDIAIVGFNDNEESKFANPSITTLHVPTKAMGEEAFLSLMSQLENPDRIRVKKTVPTHMVERKTT